MEGFRRTIGFPAVAALLMFAAVMVQETVAVRYTVGDRGWAPNVNYTIWALEHQFYNGDWLSSEVTNVKAIIESLIQREGCLIVIDAGRQEADGKNARPSRNDRILAATPN